MQNTWASTVVVDVCGKSWFCHCGNLKFAKVLLVREFLLTGFTLIQEVLMKLKNRRKIPDTASQGQICHDKWYIQVETSARKMLDNLDNSNFESKHLRLWGNTRTTPSIGITPSSVQHHGPSSSFWAWSVCLVLPDVSGHDLWTPQDVHISTVRSWSHDARKGWKWYFRWKLLLFQDVPTCSNQPFWSFYPETCSKLLFWSQPIVLVHDVGQVLIQDAIHVFDRNEIQLDLALLGIDFLAHQVLLFGMSSLEVDLLILWTSYTKYAVAVLHVAMPSPLRVMSIDVTSKTTSPVPLLDFSATPSSTYRWHYLK